MKSRNLSSLLGIALEGETMQAVLMRRNGRRVQVKKTIRVDLALDPINNDPELVGREIQNHLSAAGIREHRCVVCLPVKRVLTLGIDLPDLAEADVQDYIDVQAERAFPFSPEDLVIATSRYRSRSGSQGALLAAVPQHHISALLKALQAARLRPAAILAGIVTLVAESRQSEGEVTLTVGERGAEFAVSIDRSIVALRAIDALHGEDPASEIDVDEIARQLRITIGQLPEGVREAVRTVRVFGRDSLIESLIARLSEPLDLMGLAIERGDLRSALPYMDLDGQAAPSPGLAAATASPLLGNPTDFDFLPPRVSRLKQLTGRVSSRGTRWLAVAGVALVLATAGAFLWQHHRLSRLEKEWARIAPRVTELSAVQDNIRKFRPWYDDNARSLQIARALTRAFPEEGTVWAKSFEILQPVDSPLPVVSCSGKARNNDDWLRMLGRLRDTEGVEDLRFQQVRGADPLQFTLTFRWNGGAGDGV